MNNLPSSWVIWFHNPVDTNWDSSSYMKLHEIDTVESFWEVYLRLEPTMIQEGMFFLMKKGIEPLWENEDNINGGCWSYKISKKEAHKSWEELSKILCCEKIVNKSEKINGISISPKKMFCILKIWNNDSNYNDKRFLNPIYNLKKDQCIYKAHKNRT